MRKNQRNVDKIVIQKIIGYCDNIESFIAQFNGSLEVYQSETAFRYACDMCIFQIGELTTRLSEKFKTQCPEIPWRKIKALRNIHAHDYENVDLEIMWEIITKNIPELKAQLTKILSQKEEIEEA